MDIRLAGLGICAVFALAPAPALAAEEVARVAGVVVDRDELAAPAAGPETELARFYDRVWSGVSGHYIEQNGLAAMPQEIAEVLDYEREFARKDRAQRARKLADLERQLAAPDLPAEERARLEAFRATLERLARSDAVADREPPPDSAREAARCAPWVELWKLNRALYAQYGGVVALTRFGPFPHGARLALFEDYERQGLLQFADAELRERLFALLAAPPAIPLAAGQVDFTPYWKQPIPSSYFPE
jgi:hypothetical protein